MKRPMLVELHTNHPVEVIRQILHPASWVGGRWKLVAMQPSKGHADERLRFEVTYTGIDYETERPISPRRERALAMDDIARLEAIITAVVYPRTIA